MAINYFFDIVTGMCTVSVHVCRFMHFNPRCAFFSPPTCEGNGGESNRDEAGCVSSCRWRCCCCPPSGQTWSWPWFCRPPPLCNLTSGPGAPPSCSHHGAYPVDRLGLGAAPCACRCGPCHLRPLLRLPGVLGRVRGEGCKRGKGGRRGG